MTATMMLAKGSKGIWLGLMIVAEGDKVSEYRAEDRRVAAVTLALTQELVKLETGKKLVVEPGDHQPPPLVG